MKIGIVGPTDVDKRCGLLELTPEFFYDSLRRILSLLEGHELVLVPHKGSMSHWAAKEFSGKVIGVVPESDKEWGIDYLDKACCDTVVDAGSWRNVPEVLDETSDALLVLGLGCGELVEVCQAKWFKVHKVIVVEDFVSQRLHEEAEQNLPIEYISMGEIDRLPEMLR